MDGVRNWRNDQPTEKQMKLIFEMHEMADHPLPRFEGKTKGEASDYIDKYIKDAHTLCYSAHEDAGDR